MGSVVGQKALDGVGRGALVVLALLLAAVWRAGLGLEDTGAAAGSEIVFLSETDFVTPRLCGYPNYLDLKAGMASIEAAAAFDQQMVFVRVGGCDRLVRATFATPEFFPVFQARPREGEIPGPGSPPSAVLSDAAWKGLFAGNPSVVGRAFVCNGETTRVSGVMPPEFSFPEDTEIWLPLSTASSNLDRSSARFRLVARLGPGYDFQKAQKEWKLCLRKLSREMPEYYEGSGELLSPIELYPRYSGVGIVAEAMDPAEPIGIASGRNVTPSQTGLDDFGVGKKPAAKRAG